MDTICVELVLKQQLIVFLNKTEIKPNDLGRNSFTQHNSKCCTKYKMHSIKVILGNYPGTDNLVAAILLINR